MFAVFIFTCTLYCTTNLLTVLTLELRQNNHILVILVCPTCIHIPLPLCFYLCIYNHHNYKPHPKPYPCPSPILTLTLRPSLHLDQCFKEVETDQNVLTFQKCPHLISNWSSHNKKRVQTRTHTHTTC